MTGHAPPQYIRPFLKLINEPEPCQVYKVPWVVSLIPVVMYRTGGGAVRTLVALDHSLSFGKAHNLLGKVQVVIVYHTREDDQVPVS
jgi:hypothetical protein